MDTRGNQRAATLLILSVLVLLAAAVNLHKAVHIDDTAYLEMARGILRSPLRPMSVSLNWGDFAEPAWRLMNQPPLFFYVLAGGMAVFGTSELMAHAVMAVVSAVAIFLFHGVARRTAQPRPLLLTTLFALGPAFLPGQNLMTDVPLLVAWLACFDALLAARGPEARGRQYLAAAVSIAAACLIKYVSVALVPAFALVLVYRRHWRPLWLLAIPLGVLCGWSAWNYFDYGGIHLFSRPTTFHIESMRIRGLEWVAGVGVAAPFGLLLWSQRSWGRLSIPACAMPFVAGWLVFERARSVRHPVLDAILWGASVCLGVMTLLFVTGGLLAGWRRRQPEPAGDPIAVIVLWLLAAGGSIVVLAPFLAMRHILLAMPPLLLLCGSVGREVFERRAAAVTAVVMTAGLGIAMAASDYMYADVYRRWAPRLAAEQRADGHTIWAVGHWGWQWYAEAAGMRIYDQHATQLRPGDTVIVSRASDAQAVLPEHTRRLRLVRSFEVPASAVTCLRTFRKTPLGGYYAYRWMNRTLPFGLTRDPLDVFDVYVVD